MDAKELRQRAEQHNAAYAEITQSPLFGGAAKVQVAATVALINRDILNLLAEIVSGKENEGVASALDFVVQRNAGARAESTESLKKKS